MGYRSSMRVLVIALWTIATGACIFGRDGAIQRQQRQRARELMPARLRPPLIHKQGEPKIARLRVYGGHQYRAQNLRWTERFSDQLDAANQYLVPAFGIRLEVAEFRPWERKSNADDLSVILAELETVDPGTDVDWVVGLVTALSTASPSFLNLGMARPIGRHLVLRGYSDVAERKIIAQVLDRLDESTHESVYESRKQHKQAAVLLHEWAHTLGAVHVRARKRMMSATYSKDTVGFSKQCEQLVREVIDVRLRAAGDEPPVAVARALRKHLDNNPWEGWVVDERGQLMEILAAVTVAAEVPPEDDNSNTRAVPAEAQAQYDRVRSLASRGMVDQALGELEALLAAYPAHTVFRLTACQLSLPAQGSPSETAVGHCQRVAALDPSHTGGDLALSRAYAQAGDMARAGAVLAALQNRIPAMPRDQDQAWTTLLGAYQGLNAITWTENAIAAAPSSVDTAEPAAWVARVRRRYGLPPNGKRHRIAPERESEYLADVRAVLDSVYSKQFAQAQRRAQQGLRKFPNAPGLQAAMCDLELRQGRYAPARSRCQKALAAYSEASWPRYLLGIIELRYRRTGAGIRHLERSIALDPDLRQAYHALYKAYARRRDRKAQERLDQSYIDRFKTPIPK